MKKHKILIQSCIIIIVIILTISLANAIMGYGFFVFYNLGYGLLLSLILPLFFTYKEKGTFTSLGFKKLGKKQITVVICFVVLSVGGQLIPLDISDVNFGLLSISCVPLIMTTFFEEFLFRGYMQTQFEKKYGWIAAVLLSGLFFSIYHLGYPGFRTIADVLILFVVGIGFALVFKLSGGNVIVSYLVNLPNAFLTYILKSEQFPVFNTDTTIFASITIAIIVSIMLFYGRMFKANKPTSQQEE